MKKYIEIIQHKLVKDRLSLKNDINSTVLT